MSVFENITNKIFQVSELELLLRESIAYKIQLKAETVKD